MLKKKRKSFNLFRSLLCNAATTCLSREESEVQIRYEFTLSKLRTRTGYFNI